MFLNRFWHVISTGGGLFEVRNGSEAFGVDEQRRTCTCRLWQLSGLPCCHAIAVIFRLHKSVEEYVPACFRKQAFQSTYNQYLKPLGGMSFWPDCSDMPRVLPPKPKKMPGRPRKKRIRAPHEHKNTSKVCRGGGTMTCSNCYQKGHNKKGCQNPTVHLPPEEPKKKGRPTKKRVEEPTIVDEDLEGVGMSRMSTDHVVDERPVEAGVGGSSMKCSNCKQKGHNKKSCKNPTVVLPPKPPKKRGRPTKKQVEGPSLVDEDFANVVDEPHVQPDVGVDEISNRDFANVVDEPHVEPEVGVDEPHVSGIGVGGSGIVEGSSRRGRVKTTVKRGGPGYNVHKIPAGRFTTLSRWFGIGEDDMDSDPISCSDEPNHNAGTFFFPLTQQVTIKLT